MQTVFDKANSEAIKDGIVTLKDGTQADATENPQSGGDLTQTIGTATTHMFIYAGQPDPEHLSQIQTIVSNWTTGATGPNSTITILAGNQNPQQLEINGVRVEVLPATEANVEKAWQTIGGNAAPTDEYVFELLDHGGLANNVANPPDVPAASGGAPGQQSFSIEIPNSQFRDAEIAALQEAIPEPDGVGFHLVTLADLSTLTLTDIEISLDDGTGFAPLGTLGDASQETVISHDGSPATQFRLDVDWDELLRPAQDAPLGGSTTEVVQITSLSAVEFEIDQIGLTLGTWAPFNLDDLLPAPGGGPVMGLTEPILGLEPDEGPTMAAAVTGENAGDDAVEFSIVLDTLDQSPLNGEVFVVLGNGNGDLAGISVEDNDALLDLLVDIVFDVKAEEKDENGDHASDTIAGDIGFVTPIYGNEPISLRLEGDGLNTASFDGTPITIAIPLDEEGLKETDLEPLLMEVEIGEDAVFEFLSKEGFPLNGDEFKGVVLQGSLTLADPLGGQAIPEPSTTLILLACLVCLAAAWHRRQEPVVA